MVRRMPSSWNHLKAARLGMLRDCWLGKSALNINRGDAPARAAACDVFKGNSALLVPAAWQAGLQENVQMRMPQGVQPFVPHLDEVPV